MKNSVLVTGGAGFLGRAVARVYQRLGWHVIGIGHAKWSPDAAAAAGYAAWHSANVDTAGLSELEGKFDVVVHCGGNGSVGYSLEHPLQDFEKTVQSTVELLEFLRVTKSKAVLVYPSSAGVYGAKDDAPIRETDALNPISPYGYHKRIAEELLQSYSRTYGTKVVIIRFFSIYGSGLTKQLLWDACTKLHRGGTAEFWGTGEETRDWISVGDAADLIISASASKEKFLVINGASGTRVTVSEVLDRLKRALGVDTRILFNGTVRDGDPRFYHADVARTLALGWRPETSLDHGIAQYAGWFKEYFNG
jgi:UDP-glucose 4-epimerase